MADRADLPTKAISIRQPWAWAIINAGKNIENRGWLTNFRGPVCVHAAKGAARAEYDFAAEFIFRATGSNAPDAPALVDRGGIIGVAEIVDCVRTHPSPWFFGPYGFVLANVRPVEFIPVKGALGFFDWRKRVEAAR
ncbi:ASCH domain-containing protein [Cereibacter azotoformans]|uniref:ASCH domain-containing protein n=1 Tax=Cereibacter azotoformans TaxID=43057 RepID=UPI000E3585FF|nr:ASCH domain-containing protein [Cereibacter azotoformans]AXQ93171.1 hypothetical protein D0Z66_04700 [Cereibacter sphaeroides]UIJ31480.1 ASCH domain-containing protein [Cereibacter azotoformans]